MKKKLAQNNFFTLIIFLTVFFASSSVFADAWTLASLKFALKQQSSAQTNLQMTTVLPQLILEQVADSSLRTISASEELDRELYSLQTERLSLFLQLSKENKTRDALVLSKDNPRQLKKSIIEEDKKIQEIKDKIDENLKKVDETNAKYEKKINSDQKGEEETRIFGRLPFPFFHRNDEDKPATEGVALYKNDTAALFTPSQNAENEGLESFTYGKEISDAKINGLLSGDILIFGDYASVTVNLYVFPGAKCVGTVTEVGNTSDLISIAQAVVRNLTPKIANSLPVKIRFEIEPEEAAKTAEISVDGLILPSSEDFIVEAGIHSITIGAKNYESQTISYQFSGEEIFTVRTTLLPLVSGEASIRLKKIKDGIFYFNGSQSAKVDESNPYANLSINGKTVLAKFSETEGESAFVVIPEYMAYDGNTLLVNAKPYDRAKNIDKRRRRMYTAYSALICSLPFTFYCVGNLNSAVNAYNAGRIDYSEAQKWQTRAYGTIGISCTAGAWFVFEMVRYLFAANEVLPASAKFDKTQKISGE